MDILSGAAGFVLGYIVPFLFVLTVVVFIHEMGHFLVGRWCGVGVRAFSVGFGPELFGFNDRHGTRWKLSAIPLGGYVKFAGDANGASVPNRDEMNAMSAAERAESFHHKSVAKRAAIVAAGPIANFLLAIAIFAGSAYINGKQVLVPRIDAVQPGTPAEAAGFQKGDLIVAIDGHPVEGFADVQRVIVGRAGEQTNFTVERDGEQINITAVPALREIETELGRQRIGQLGIQASRESGDLRHRNFGLVESLGVGVMESWFVVERTFDYIGKVFTGRESADQLSGPIRIAQASGYVANVGFGALLGLTAILSVSIGLINLFPVPLLDGGHLLFYSIEAVRGRPLSERMQEIGFRIGLAFVVMLMLVATWNDIVHLGATFSGAKG